MQFSLLIYIVVIFAVMYYLMIRTTKQKRAKQHRELINNIQSGQRIKLLVVLKVLLKQ